MAGDARRQHCRCCEGERRSVTQGRGVVGSAVVAGVTMTERPRCMNVALIVGVTLIVIVTRRVGRKGALRRRLRPGGAAECGVACLPQRWADTQRDLRMRNPVRMSGELRTEQARSQHESERERRQARKRTGP
jgi:hypothetical protein